jgi:membrane protein
MAPSKALWRGVLDTATSDRISLVAAGCAFYAMLALFPALSLVISLYGLFFDVATVQPQLAVLEAVMPAGGFRLIAARVQELIAKPTSLLGWGAGVSATLALWSASAGIRAVLGALNLAHGQHERRHPLLFYATALMLTVGAILAVIVGIAFLVLLPSLLDIMGLEPLESALARLASVVLLLVSVLLSIGLLYRFGPARRPRFWRLVSPGSVTATLLWVLASALFSYYVRRLGAFDENYGPLGAAIGLLMWLYVSVYVILLGAELDAELARRREARGEPQRTEPELAEPRRHALPVFLPIG